ncbi:tRNA-specific adenosine deaminase [Lactobacillus sp. S2-2]|uniref:tRNA adenosine(34) deaminase TadA n=1 Tax=Lactobacillus sp. S2-2 TaxID=2692917 RepID=UPI001F0144FA|nr:tRNA adenosine(34) deaminase TadA [Lactobacillus sp. S2-2]MCF6515656.1 tRNA-specific adenosine deaminase [Lactobacillus sp. S2-2]
MMNYDSYYMREALKEAKKAATIGEIPIGAVVVKDNQIIGRGHNFREHSNIAMQHAEINAIEQANINQKSWRLIDCTMYVTIEPCVMCAGAILNSRIKRVVYGAENKKAGSINSLYQLLSDSRQNHQVEVTNGIEFEEASKIMKEFFKNKRKS